MGQNGESPEKSEREESIISDTAKGFIDRVNNPLLGAILSAFIIWNWKWIYLFWKADETTAAPVLNKFENEFWNMGFSTCPSSWGIVTPLLLGTLYFFLNPFFKMIVLIAYHRLNEITAEKILRAKNKVPISSEEAERLNYRIRQLHTLNSELQKKLDKRRTGTMEAIEKACNTLTKKEYLICKREDGMAPPYSRFVEIHQRNISFPSTTASGSIGYCRMGLSEGELVQTKGRVELSVDEGFYTFSSSGEIIQIDDKSPELFGSLDHIKKNPKGKIYIVSWVKNTKPYATDKNFQETIKKWAISVDTDRCIELDQIKEIKGKQ